MISDSLRQRPEPGAAFAVFRGDTVALALDVPGAPAGTAFVRTNLGHGTIARAEIIREVDAAESPLGRDWDDVPMREVSPGRYVATLGLAEPGHFEAKCYFLPEGADDPVWPPGPNVCFNVKPAEASCGALIYNAFVRQFGPNKEGRFRPAASEATIAALDAQGFAVIPPSGTFRDLARELDFIVGVLGCRFIQLLPIHPTPTTYGRMGRFGSPYAALSFTEVDPALAEFDPKATPLDQFLELVDAVHSRNASLILDMAINHTGWAASLHGSHPHWLARGPDGSIQRPGAWGVVWEDLARLDYSRRDLWRYMAEVFLTWCRRGVDGFRCDAGYMIPLAAWRYITARVRDEYPETIFFLEGLGGDLALTRELLARGGFDWAYSELFQVHGRAAIERYLEQVAAAAAREGILVHFAETHDNPRLAARSPSYAAMRTALSALVAHRGAFGFANGVEWFATERIDVHGAGSLCWGATPNQVQQIGRLARLLRHHPAFGADAELLSVGRGPGEFLALLRVHRPSGRRLLALVNLDHEKDTLARWDAAALAVAASADSAANPKTRPAPLYDLLAAARVEPSARGGDQTLLLAPAQALCLSADPRDLEAVERTAAGIPPDTLVRQRLRGTLLAGLAGLDARRGAAELGDFDLDRAASELARDPAAFYASLGRSRVGEPRVVRWRWPEDCRRTVMIPPGHLLLATAPYPFRAEIRDVHSPVRGRERTLAGGVSFRTEAGSHALALGPLEPPHRDRPLQLTLAVYTPQRAVHERAPLLLLPPAVGARVTTVFDRAACLAEPLVLLGTNGRGAMMRARVSWGSLLSRYDGLLAANLDPQVPVDRRMMLARCRAWVVHQGTSQAVGPETLARFAFDYRSRGCWEFRIPVGRGRHIVLLVGLEMASGENAVRLHFHRARAGGQPGHLEDSRPIRLIVRPDIEDRGFHETTKAASGPEGAWPAAVAAGRQGFVFAPEPPRRLEMTADAGQFVPEPEWQYMVHRALEAERGLDPNSDLYSPGYFRAELAGGQSVTLTASASQEPSGSPEARGVASRPDPHWVPRFFEAHPQPIPLAEALAQALDHYVARRGGGHTVIAGFPWFLDWGRDTLVVVRGLAAAGRVEVARSILREFARLEDRGTLPNMIRGGEAGDRDTSDAPLWFFVACADLLAAASRAGVRDAAEFLELDCGGRTIRQVLLALGRSLASGAANGVAMDRESGLLFSPAHFTWMDTNHPAATPREGYPIEIQALWHSALGLLASLDPSGPWQELASRVRASVQRLFPLPGLGYLSDCLHARPGTPAAAAVPDNCLRPNQLLAITLGLLEDRDLCSSVLEACAELLVPGAIRSLADRPVEPPLEIRHRGVLLGDPMRPYRGRYEGDEDTQRKPAYHNGTAWTWLFPSYAEAWVVVHGEGGRSTALAWLAGSIRLLDAGCVGHVPEILDGDSPHGQRGCDAQAWAVSELLRVWLKLGGASEGNSNVVNGN